MRARFTVYLEKAEEGGYIVKCLEVPVASQGETEKETLKNIKEAIEGYLKVKAEILSKEAKGERVKVYVETTSVLLA